jgi:nicotinate dehydrogenase subunit B
MMSATKETTIDVFGATLTRGALVKGGGALVAGLSVAGAGFGATAAKAAPDDGGTSSLDPTLPSSWLDINADNTIVLRTGKIELGQGSASTAFAMITAEELNVPYTAITQVIMGDTDRTPDGGFSAGYMGGGSPNVRLVAAYVYQALLQVASTQLGVPVASLTVTNGVVTGGGKSVSYGQLVSGQQLNLTIPVTGPLPNGAFGVSVLGNPPTKPVSDYQVIGQSIPMRTIPPIVTGTATYVGDVTLPGMLHARVVHPKTLGSSLISVGKLDKSQFPHTQIVVKGNLVAVVDPLEYVAIEAASLLAAKTQWTEWTGLPGSDNLYGALRKLPWQAPTQGGANNGQPAAAIAGAAKTLSATYEYPFEKHAPIGPTAAVADYRSDGTVWVYSHSANPQAQRTVIAQMLNTSPANVIVRNFDGSGHYGRSNGGSTGAEEEAVIISQIVGKPIRLQWMRWDDMQWSTQHSPQISDVQAGLDAHGNLVAYTANHYAPGGQDDRPVGALLAGLPTMAAPGSSTPPPANFIQYTSWGMSDTWVYNLLPNALEQAFGSYQVGTNPSLPQNFDTQVGLRAHSMRTPGQRQQNFVREAFFNEVASAAGMDPFQFRLNNTNAPRLISVINSVKEAAGWETRPSPSPSAATTGSKPLVGQGCSVMLRSNAYWACVAQVTVVPKTGKVKVTHITTAVDPGIVVNPHQLRRMAEGGATMGTSETLHEEVHFNTGAITDHDWVTFPILRMIELPVIKVVIINNPSVGAYGAGGEGPNGFVPAAIVSAVFDATGKMPRRLPLIPGYIRALMST